MPYHLGNPPCGTKICFWLIILLSLPVILSIILSMLPLFSTYNLKLLSYVHHYSSLALSAVAIIHTYLVVHSRSEKDNGEYNTV